MNIQSKSVKRNDKGLEREAFLKLLIFLAELDGNLTDEEISYYEKAAKRIGLKDKNISQIYEQIRVEQPSIEDLTRQINDENIKEKLIEELLRLCYVDGEYTIVEKNGMRDICILLNYSLLNLREQEAAIEQSISETNDDKENETVDLKHVAGVFAKAGRKAASIAIDKATEGGSDLAQAISSGIGKVGTKISASVATAKRVREENQALREELGKMTLSETVKQKVILQLNEKITSLKQQLDEERLRNRKNEEMIRLLEAQIEDLAATIEAAENARVA